MSLQKSTMTMEQLLEQLITKVFIVTVISYNITDVSPGED